MSFFITILILQKYGRNLILGYELCRLSLLWNQKTDPATPPGPSIEYSNKLWCRKKNAVVVDIHPHVTVCRWNCMPGLYATIPYTVVWGDISQGGAKLLQISCGSKIQNGWLVAILNFHFSTYKKLWEKIKIFILQGTVWNFKIYNLAHFSTKHWYI